MAHYAFIDENNIVTQVITGRDELDIVNSISDWEEFYSKEFGLMCKRTSYNTVEGGHLVGGVPFRKNYAGLGYSYNEELDAFIPPKIYDSWVFDNEKCIWVPPLEHPNDGKVYFWFEESESWVAIESNDPPETWVLDETTGFMMPPIPYPEDGFPYIWDIEINNWVVLDENYKIE
jgi:hypothetical protein